MTRSRLPPTHRGGGADRLSMRRRSTGRWPGRARQLWSGSAPGGWGRASAPEDRSSTIVRPAPLERRRRRSRRRRRRAPSDRWMEAGRSSASLCRPGPDQSPDRARRGSSGEPAPHRRRRWAADLESSNLGRRPVRSRRGSPRTAAHRAELRGRDLEPVLVTTASDRPSEGRPPIHAHAGPPREPAPSRRSAKSARQLA